MCWPGIWSNYKMLAICMVFFEMFVLWKLGIVASRALLIAGGKHILRLLEVCACYLMQELGSFRCLRQAKFCLFSRVATIKYTWFEWFQVWVITHQESKSHQDCGLFKVQAKQKIVLVFGKKMFHLLYYVEFFKCPPAPRF